MNWSNLIIFYIGFFWGKYNLQIQHYIYLQVSRLKQYFKEKQKEHEEWERRF